MVNKTIELTKFQGEQLVELIELEIENMQELDRQSKDEYFKKTFILSLKSILEQIDPESDLLKS